MALTIRGNGWQGAMQLHRIPSMRSSPFLPHFIYVGSKIGR
jgi:hypothetical protein